MAIEVKIPTILRSYTGGSKSVEAKGDTLSAIDGQIRRTFDWLSERLKYWQREIKVRQVGYIGDVFFGDLHFEYTVPGA